MSLDSLQKVLAKNYPDYYRLFYGNNRIGITQIQSQLTSKKVLIDYAINDTSLIVYVIGKNSGEHTNIEMTIFDPSSTALRNLISCVATFQSDNLQPGFTDSSIFYSSTDALQGVNFIASSGQIDAGTFKLYGIS